MPEPVKTARAVVPNAGIEAWYARNLKALVRHMAKATEREVLAAYEERLMAQDRARWGDSLDAEFLEVLEAIFGRLRVRLDTAARLLAGKLSRDTGSYTWKNVNAALKEAGFTVEMGLTAREAAEMQKIIEANVRLIKSIPDQYFDRVREAVGESFAKGRDLHGLSETIEPWIEVKGKEKRRERMGPEEALKREKEIAERRAAIIARDQNNKATHALTSARYQEMGLTRAIWMHRPGGKVPRPTHMAMYGLEFDLNVGLFDPDPKVNKPIQPGELINCHCTMKPVLPRLTPPADPVSGGVTSAVTVLERAA